MISDAGITLASGVAYVALVLSLIGHVRIAIRFLIHPL